MDLQSETLKTPLANTALRTSENAYSAFLLTEALINLQFRGVLKSRYIAGQWFNLWKGGLLILDLLSLGEERATFVSFSLHLGLRGWLRLVIVALPGLFIYLFNIKPERPLQLIVSQIADLVHLVNK